VDLDVPPPRDLSAPPRTLMAELARHVDQAAAAQVCTDLLGGADPHDYPGALAYLAGRGTEKFLAGTWGPKYWSRVWGARGLLYVWSSDATPAVLAGLSDPEWRVAEMCLKVSAKREVPTAGDGAVQLADHELARVRAAAMRLLGKVGDTEHVATVRVGLDDPDADVRRHADGALLAMTERLDLARAPDQ